MNFKLLHPADQIVLIMNRVYRGGMTTVSGGNLSVSDANGDVWITPSGIDKGSLKREDICRVTPGGEVFGRHKPSMELMFHLGIYKCRPDIGAVLHAHPPALIAFSLARVLPNTKLVGNTRGLIGNMSSSAYALPGSRELTDNIRAEFEKGSDVVMLQNHGVVVGAGDLHKAFMKFETLETTAASEIYARKLGTLRELSEDDLNLVNKHERLRENEIPRERIPSPEECEIRREMSELVRRAYRQKLFTALQGTLSARIKDGVFIVTPHGADRAYIEENDLVLIKNGRCERGKIPAHTAGLHKMIYENNPDINAIACANPPHAMAFAVTDAEFLPRTIPESYIMLRDVKRIPFGAFYLNREEVSRMFSCKTPALICGGNRVIVTGTGLINAFDRLEVMEATAHSIIAAGDIGPIVPISEDEAADIKTAFHLS